MDDDEYWDTALQNITYYFEHRNIYHSLMKDSKNEKDMVYSYKGYNDTRGDEVATIVLEAYANGVDFATLIKKNSTVRYYWNQVLSDKIAKEKAREREEERLRKLAEKRAIEQAKREEVMTKLTPEELEAFGLLKKAKKVTKR